MRRASGLALDGGPMKRAVVTMLLLLSMPIGCSGNGEGIRDADSDSDSDSDSGTGTGTETNTGTGTGTDDLYDVDRDGHLSLACVGDDCDDADATVYPGAEDWLWDGVDQSCDGVDGI